MATGNVTNVQQALTTSAQVKTVPGQFYGYAIYNPNASAVYVSFYNSVAAPTIGSATNLLFQFAVPPTNQVSIEFADGIDFNAGLWVAVATTATGSTAPASGLTITTVYGR